MVGAGISGLAIAYELIQRGERAPGRLEIVCVDAAERAGGHVRTERADGYVCEWGPNGFLDNTPATLALARRLGLADRLVKADEAAAIRWIVRGGKPRRVPVTPLAFLKSDVLPIAGRLRVGLEPFVRRSTDPDESVHAFARRRIGRAAADVLVAAMVQGVWAGDARRISLAAAFPKMAAMERDHGGLVRAMFAKKRATAKGEDGDDDGGGPAGPGGTLTSFRDGMGTLIDALVDGIGGSLRLGHPIEAVADAGARGFRVIPAHGPAETFGAVVLACPAAVAADLVEGGDEALATAMRAIPCAPVAVTHLGYVASSLRETPVGFGFLAPPCERRALLGTLFASNIFPGRAPERRILLTTMAGGALEPAVASESDDALVARARGELNALLGIEVGPVFTRVFRHPRGIPQYELGHLDRVDTIERRAAAHPGLFVAGNSYRGVSLNRCVEEAPRVAEAVLGHLGLGSAT